MTREEAMKIVRENYPHFGTTEPWLDLEKALATLIPELAESEDERIRKEIVGVIQKHYPNTPESYRWIAYLEKQKDSVSNAKYIEDIAHAFEDGRKKGIEEKQNSAPISCSHENGTPTESKATINGEPIQTENQSIDIPLVEWSDEDEKMFKEALTDIIYAKNELNKKGCEGLAKSALDAFNWLNTRFKSLHPQPEKELSIEKAIQWLDDTFCFLDNSSGRGRDYEITTHDFDSLEEMYDSFRKAVTVDSEPHWKPSEEQMKALDKAIPVCMGVVGRDESAPLETLLRDLNKL